MFDLFNKTAEMHLVNPDIHNMCVWPVLTVVTQKALLGADLSRS